MLKSELTPKVKETLKFVYEAVSILGGEAFVNYIDELVANCKNEKELVDIISNPLNLYAEPKSEPEQGALRRFIEKYDLIITENVELKHLGTDEEGNGVVTQKQRTIIPLYTRRNQQIISKEGNSAGDASVRSVNGQAAGDDAVGVFADTEINTLGLHNSEAILRELTGWASQNLTAKAEAKRALIQEGEVSLKDLSNNTEDNKTLIWVDAMLKVMGIDSDLIQPPLMPKNK